MSQNIKNNINLIKCIHIYFPINKLYKTLKKRMEVLNLKFNMF